MNKKILLIDILKMLHFFNKTFCYLLFYFLILLLTKTFLNFKSVYLALMSTNSATNTTLLCIWTRSFCSRVLLHLILSMVNFNKLLYFFLPSTLLEVHHKTWLLAEFFDLSEINI